MASCLLSLLSLLAWGERTQKEKQRLGFGREQQKKHFEIMEDEEEEDEEEEEEIKKKKMR